MSARSLSQTLVTGVYRTGSEFIANLIGCHPAISVSMYSVNAPRFIYGRYDPISEPAQYRRALADLSERLWQRYQRKLDTDRVIADLEQHGIIDYGVLYDTVMCSLYLEEPAKHWAEKNQLLWREIPSFLSSMPNGRAILVLRDPRSVVASFKKYTYAAPPAYLGAVFNCLDAMQHAIRYERELDAQRYLTVRYEDAARAPQETAERIWRFLGLDGRYDVNDRAGWVDAHGRPWRANSSFHANDDARPFEIAASIRRWEGELDRAELSLAEGVCGEIMPRFGYEATLAGGPDWLSAFRLFAHDDQITGYFRRWLVKGEGVEAFPTDPLDPANWKDD